MFWQVEFPPKTQRNLEHQAKGNVNTTSSDYESLDFVMEFLVLEQHVNVRHKNIALCCDNMVSWVRRLSEKSIRAARLMWVLALRMKVNQTSPIVSLSVAGKETRKQISLREFSETARTTV